MKAIERLRNELVLNDEEPNPIEDDVMAVCDVAEAAVAWVEAVRDPSTSTLDVAAKATLVIAAVSKAGQDA